METIVELFTGFLDSGKTTLIREALHSPDFLDYNQTLLIVCEEGDEEYDEAWLKKNGIIKCICVSRGISIIPLWNDNDV